MRRIRRLFGFVVLTSLLTGCGEADAGEVAALCRFARPWDRPKCLREAQALEAKLQRKAPRESEGRSMSRREAAAHAEANRQIMLNREQEQIDRIYDSMPGGSRY
ncbi:MAG TPA: hypothetical protein VMK12_07370 [Anaeromyxobacteraceae bacterium]|nr:hypothetical protein [Anaeromyxobacteraceae bacterium]